jgi:hypothetical protein
MLRRDWDVFFLGTAMTLKLLAAFFEKLYLLQKYSEKS